MLWRIEGLADRFLYFNDDMMLVGPVEPTDFFSNEGKVNLRGRWTQLARAARKGEWLPRQQQAAGRRNVGYTSDHFFSSNHMIYPCATGDGRAIRGVQARLPRQCRVPVPQPQAVLADLGPQSPVAQVGPGTGGQAPKHRRISRGATA